MGLAEPENRTGPLAVLPLGQPDFNAVFAASSRFVSRVLFKLGVPRADVPDVSQEVFVVVHRRLPDYDARAPLRSWIYGICVRTASHHRRRLRARREQSEPGLPEAATPSHQEQDLEHGRAEAHLHTTLEKLDEDQRAVFVLYELEELPMSEVSVALGCPLQTAYSRLYAARKAVMLAFQRLPHAKAAR